MQEYSLQLPFYDPVILNCIKIIPTSLLPARHSTLGVNKNAIGKECFEITETACGTLSLKVKYYKTH